MKVLRAAPLTTFALGLIGLVCVVVACLAPRPLLAAPAAPAPGGGAASVVADFIRAFNKHDLKAIMPLVGDNFVQIFPDGNFVGGKDAEQATLTSVFAGSPHVTMIVDHLIGDNVTAAAQVSMMIEPPKGEPPAAQYAYFFSVVDGKIIAIAAYERGAQAQKEAGAKP